jgi:hypothetical protein
MATSPRPREFDSFRRRLGHVLAGQVRWKRQLGILLEVGYEGEEIQPIFNLWEIYQDLLEDSEEFDQEYFESQAFDAVINYLYPVGAGVAPEWAGDIVRQKLVGLFLGRK